MKNLVIFTSKIREITYGLSIRVFATNFQLLPFFQYKNPIFFTDAKNIKNCYPFGLEVLVYTKNCGTRSEPLLNNAWLGESSNMSGLRPFFGPRNKKLENWHRMRFFEKVNSISLQWTV